MDDKNVDRRYPVGVQSFPEIREGGYVYVDKTRYVYKMVKAGKYYFLSRPRRFGKSLLLSTIEAYFRGRRELFKGLAIDSLTDEWDAHEILHIDLNSGDFNSEESLNHYLDHILSQWERKYGVTHIAVMPSQRFGDVIKAAYERSGRKVVILVDEYDKPMLSVLENDALSDRLREIMKSFYSNLKSLDDYIQFGMLTGVSRFSKVSIFSDLNNLRDISFEPMFSGVCGVSSEELERYFGKGITSLAEQKGKTQEEIFIELKRRYDGYHFAKNMEDIYNPYSLVRVFSALDFDNYWAESGTPTYVAKLLKRYDEPLQDIDGYTIDSTRLATEGIMTKSLIPTLYQAGYLTIKGYDEEFSEYMLGYPNTEVEESFIRFLKPLYLGEQANNSEFNIKRFVADLKKGHTESFMTRVNSMLSGVPHLGGEDSHEHTFRNAVYLIFKMVGFHTEVEEHTSDGRIDMVVDTPELVYVFEFKVDKTAEEAMSQIMKKKYWRKFEANGKRIVLVGANFSTVQKAIDDFCIETL